MSGAFEVQAETHHSAEDVAVIGAAYVEAVSQTRLLKEMQDAQHNAWKSLARYKFMQFGYWVGIWVHLNRIHGGRAPNPWACLVSIARRELARIGEQK